MQSAGGAKAFELADRTLALEPRVPGSRHTTARSTNGAWGTRFGADCDGRGLGANGLPTIANAGFNLRAENVPAITPRGFVVFGSATTSPGVPLAPLCGMTGCEGHSSADLAHAGRRTAVACRCLGPAHGPPCRRAATSRRVEARCAGSPARVAWCAA